MCSGLHKTRVTIQLCRAEGKYVPVRVAFFQVTALVLFALQIVASPLDQGPAECTPLLLRKHGGL